jgi:hypothetical protein
LLSEYIGGEMLTFVIGVDRHLSSPRPSLDDTRVRDGNQPKGGYGSRCPHFVWSTVLGLIALRFIHTSIYISGLSSAIVTRRP